MKIYFVYNDLGAPSHYRIFSQYEQVSLLQYRANKSILKRVHLTPFKDASALFFHRLPLTSRTLPLVVQAKLRRVPILFDSDDLVWDEREREYNFLDAHYSQDVVRKILKGTRRIRAMMRLADALVFSTPYLAEQARRMFRQPIFVNTNALSHEQTALSTAAWQQSKQMQPTNSVVIGYFSGQVKVHDEDVASVAPALCALLDQYDHVTLRIYGGLELRSGLEQARYRHRIEQRPAVDWRELPNHIAQVDINIAPLIDNPQRRSKSAVKYLEAAAVGVPTVASRLEPYSIIQHGETGMVAWGTQEWQCCLEQLVGDASTRQRIGEAARQDVLANHTTAVRAPHFASILQQAARR